jgi:competence protein ComEC
MHFEPTDRMAGARLIFPALLGFVLGSAWQLQQATLFRPQVYMGFMLLAAVLYALTATRTIALRWFAVRAGLATLALGLMAFGLTGLRASAFLEAALDPALEGRDISLTGLVAAMPQRNESGLRFRFNVESAQLDGQAVHLPSRLYLGWYADAFGAPGAVSTGDSQRPPAALEAGQRWQFTARLKAPHGSSNPFGFDYELWMWEQGMQAGGYVRAGPKDPAPQRLAQTYRHPVELARQQVREQIFQRVAEARYAGLNAALVVGDQNAIERWTPTLKSLSQTISR